MQATDKYINHKTTLNCRGRLLELNSPLVMGIINLTPDSFYDGGKLDGKDAALQQAEKMLKEGANLLDIGGMSSRPGAEIISEEEELKRVIDTLSAIHQEFPDAIISIDTLRASVAKAAVEAGAGIVNDISGGDMDEAMYDTVAQLRVPYILMHMQGSPADMQEEPTYKNVVTEVMDYFLERIDLLKAAGVQDIILDPGFGFGKTVEHNYQLLKGLPFIGQIGYPILAGVSRKSVICKVLGVKPENALNGSTAVHTLALLNGANILRVHDVKEAHEAIKIVAQYREVSL